MIKMKKLTRNDFIWDDLEGDFPPENSRENWWYSAENDLLSSDSPSLSSGLVPSLLCVAALLSSR
jgi:hypothetical protein